MLCLDSDYCTTAQSDPNLRWMYMSDDTFSDVTAHILCLNDAAREADQYQVLSESIESLRKSCCSYFDSNFVTAAVHYIDGYYSFFEHQLSPPVFIE